MTAHTDLGLTAAGSAGGGCCGGGGCMCGHSTATPTSAAAPADITIAVNGLTCANCVNHVTSAVTDVAGVTEVHIDLDPAGASAVHISTNSTVDLAAVRAAIVEAGYQPA